MKTTKKICTTLFLVILAIVMLMNNPSYAAESNRKTLGTKETHGLLDMTERKDLYCIARTRSLTYYDDVEYTIKAFVEIKGKTIVEGAYGASEKNATKVKTKDNEKNAVLAAILGGVLKQGHGNVYGEGYSHVNCNAAQKALWLYWNTWVDAVGNKYGFPKDESNSGDDVAEDVGGIVNRYVAKATAAAISTDYHVRIYFLESGLDSKQNLILVDTFGSEYEEPKPGQTEVTGKVNLSGYVWEDIANSKNNTINSKYEDGDGDLKVKGIKVHWKASDGTEIAPATTTDKNGEYSFSTTITLYNHPYGIKDKAKYDKINNSYVEFEYNGLKYTTVKYNGTLSRTNTSKGKEDTTSRRALDNQFDKVENAAVYDENNIIFKNLPNADISDANYTEKLAVSAVTKNIAKNLMTTAEENNWTKTKTFCIKHCQVGEGPHLVNKITTEAGSEIKIYCNGEVEIHDGSNEDLTNILKGIKEIMGDDIDKGSGGLHYYSAGETNGPTHRDCRKGGKEIYEWNIKNVNLGLVKREQPDAAITSDIEQVRVIMKNQQYTYLYGNRGIKDNEQLFDYKVKFGDKYTQTYSRPINPADIAYVNYNNSDDLKVYVTYNIIIKNQSETLQMGINSIVNYFDSNYTIYTGQGSLTSAGWKEASGKKNGYKIAYNTSLKGTKLQPGSKSKVLKIEFEVSQDRIKGLLDNDATLKNFSEIFSYTTYYGKNTICAERESATDRNRVGHQYAGIDVDSTPGNAVPGKENTYEDDTDRAPSFLLTKDPNYKTVSGIVYEDTQTEDSKRNSERLGNGQKDGNEKGVENVKVELIDPRTGETAYLYYKDTSTSTGSNKKPAITYSDSEGKYSFGDGSTCGVVADNYIIKYTYGNADKGEDGNGNKIGETKINGNVINARNYKSTVINDTNVKNVIKGNGSDTWYLNMDSNKDTSIAVDDLKQRLETENLKNSNYDNKMNMSAYSKEFMAKIHYTQDEKTKVDNNGGTFPSDCTVFDFGIIERPREDLVINKTISKVKVTLANGQLLIEGDPRNDKINYVKAIGFKTNTDREGREIAEFSSIDKMLTMEIDSELLQGAKLEVWYSVTLTNNSEKDYEYEKDYIDIGSKDSNQILNYITTDSQANYYYYGEKNGLDVINRSAELVVDYMSEKMDCNIENDENKDWFKFDTDGTTPIDKDYLKNNGYISDETYETIGNQKLQILATRTFADVQPAGGTKTTSMYASTVLANKEDDTVYSNHVEIIEINGKTARTIKEVSKDSREQVAKTYKVGNYEPKLGSAHEQDDDRVRIVITPPTGITKYTTIYIISAVVGAIVIAGGIVLIKRKITKK